jgi:hypothetical protein
MLHNMLHCSMFALFGLVVNKGSTLAAWQDAGLKVNETSRDHHGIATSA